MICSSKCIQKLNIFVYLFNFHVNLLCISMCVCVYPGTFICMSQKKINDKCNTIPIKKNALYDT